MLTAWTWSGESEESAMNLTEDQRKMLTEKLLEEEPPYYKCVATNEQRHPCPARTCWSCEHQRSDYRTFSTYQDLGDCMEKLVEKGLWEAFESFCTKRWVSEKSGIRNFNVWLFRPTDESGNPHFCRLCAEFLEGLK